MHVFDLTEEEMRDFKNTLTERGVIFETGKVRRYDAKFYETVRVSHVLIKTLVFLSLALYAIVNLIGVVLAVVHKVSLTNPLATVVGVCVICFIASAIFANIHTNKKKEKGAIYIDDDTFVFNFCDGIVETPNLYYALPYDSVKKIEFQIYGVRKKQLFGGVTFTFDVSGYEVTQTIRFTNLSEIERLLESKFPSLLSVLVIDGKSRDGGEKAKDAQKPKTLCLSLAVFVAALALILVPYLFHYRNIALLLSGIVLCITALVVFLSPFLYTYPLVQGALISGVFIIIGLCVPLFIITNSKMSFFQYIIHHNEILMTTIFGIFGLCMYAYILTIVIGKVHFLLRKKDTNI